MKRVVFVKDLHCGHCVGLTPRAYQWAEKREEGAQKRNKFARIQAELWNEFDKALIDLKPYHVMLFGGDAIEGKGPRSGGTELITADRNEQIDMAVDVFNRVRFHAARGYKSVGVFGTPAHTGDQEDFEYQLIDKAGFDKFGSHEWPEVEGVVFDLKHKIGSSSIPHGRATQVLKDMLWNEIWAAQGMQPRAKMVLRAHAHFFMYVDDGDRCGMIGAALQGMGSKYGARQCSGIVKWGIEAIDVHKGEIIAVHKRHINIKTQRAAVTKL